MILLMEEILHQLVGSFRVLYIPSGCLGFLNHPTVPLHYSTPFLVICWYALATVPIKPWIFRTIEVKAFMKRGTALPNLGGKYQLFDCNDLVMEKNTSTPKNGVFIAKDALIIVLSKGFHTKWHCLDRFGRVMNILNHDYPPRSSWLYWFRMVALELPIVFWHKFHHIVYSLYMCHYIWIILYMKKHHY